MEELPHRVLRRFNRAWSQRAGVLEDSFLGSGRSLGQSRLLFELDRPGLSVRDLRTRLGLDSGYVSRLLRGLERASLVRTEVDPDDARRRVVVLTADGVTARRDLDDRSEKLALDLVTPLTERHRRRLAEALDTADRLLRAATISIEEVDPETDKAETALRAYFAELDERFVDGFVVGDDDRTPFRAPHGAFLVAMSDGVPVACGCLQPLGDGVAEIKRMWVDPSWRGAGLGGRLLRALEDAAVERGHRIVRLDTNDVLHDAIAMYQGAGYDAINRYNDNPYARHWFEKTLAT
jgi:DNA-binding MarR family transcriptional regulator